MGLLDEFSNFAQGASNAAASNITAPVDGIAWLMRKAGLGGVIGNAPVGGSDWAANQGLTKPAPGISGILGESVGGVLPMLATAGAPQIASAMNKGAENWMNSGPMFAGPGNAQRGAVSLGNDPVAYRGSHTAPMKDSGAPLNDLTKIYPDDIYSSKAAQYYGHYGNGSAQDAQSIALMQSARNRPNLPVTMYRAVPYEKSFGEQVATLDAQMATFMRRGNTPSDSALSGSAWYNNASEMRARLASAAEAQATTARLTINNGDWVTLNRAYAKEHGEGALNGNYKIISQKVPARKLFTDGNSIHEFGYDQSGNVVPELAGAMATGLLGYGAYNALSDK